MLKLEALDDNLSSVLIALLNVVFFFLIILFAGKLICSIYIAAVHGIIGWAKASELYPQCLCYGKGYNDSV